MFSTEFLLACSDACLGDFELARLNRCANLRKQMRVIGDELLKLEAEALTARWLLEHRSEMMALGSTGNPLQKAFQFSERLGIQA